MQMRPRHPSGGPHQADDLALAHALAGPDFGFGHMQIRAENALTVVDVHHIAGKIQIVHQSHLTVGAGLNGRTLRPAQIQTAMHAARLAR